MTHGQPDFGMYSDVSTIYKLSDMGELAARLGSIDTFDRRGDVVWMDDFENTINKWEWAAGGTGSARAISPEAARSTGFSLKMTTGSDAQLRAYIGRAFSFPVLGKFGIELSFTLADDQTIWRSTSRIHTGALVHRPYIEVDLVNNQLEYFGDDGLWHAFATGLSFSKSPYMFYTLKYVVDYENQRYIRCLFGGQEYDLSPYHYQVAADVPPPFLGIEFLTFGTLGVNVSTYFEDFILTQNEPP